MVAKVYFYFLGPLDASFPPPSPLCGQCATPVSASCHRSCHSVAAFGPLCAAGLLVPECSNKWLWILPSFALFEIECLLCYVCVASPPKKQQGFSRQYWFRFKAETSLYNHQSSFPFRRSTDSWQSGSVPVSQWSGNVHLYLTSLTIKTRLKLLSIIFKLAWGEYKNKTGNNITEGKRVIA